MQKSFTKKCVSVKGFFQISSGLLLSITIYAGTAGFTFADELSDSKQSTSESPGAIGVQFEQLLHQDKNTTLEIPPVYKRPLGIDAGPRLYVKKFLITGVNEWPSHGITQLIIDAYAEKIRIEMQAINAMNEHGFTQEDIDVMGYRLKATLYTDEEISFEKYRLFIEQLRKNKKYREEMSIGHLQDVANRITDYYRSQGFVIAQAYVPEQTVDDGIVTIHVQEGILGQTIITGNQHYSTGSIRRIFSELEGRSVNKQSLENALLSLSDYPGLVAYGVLQPGEKTGETDLVVKVQDEEPYSYTARLDNYGTETTGENRLTLSYTRNNLFGNADDLNLSLLQTFSPTNNLYGGIRYKTPVFTHNTVVGFGISDNAYDVGGELANFSITGEVTSANIFLSHQFVRSRKTNIYGKMDFINKAAETKIADFTLSEDTVTPLVLEVGFDSLDTEYKGINQGSIKVSQGFEGLLGALDENDVLISSRKGGSGGFATGDYTKLNWDLARLQLIDKYQNVLLRFSGQYSEDLLVPVEQSGLGGPNNVRAFTPSEFLRDTSVFLSLDWNFNAPYFYDSKAFDGWKWGEILQLSMFIDYARGTLNDPLSGTPPTINLSGYGVAAQILLPGTMQLRLDIARPANGDAAIKEEVQYYLTFSYTG